MRNKRRSKIGIKQGCSLNERTEACLKRDRKKQEWLDKNTWYLVEQWQDRAFTRPSRCPKKIIKEGLLSYEDYKKHNP